MGQKLLESIISELRERGFKAVETLARRLRTWLIPFLDPAGGRGPFLHLPIERACMKALSWFKGLDFHQGLGLPGHRCKALRI